MSNGTREKQALGVFLILIVLSTFGIAWYMVAGHSWNVAASSIDEKVGQMEGYTSIVYAGTLPVQADAKTLDSQNGSDAQTDDEKDSTDTAEKTGGDTASGSGGASSSTGSVNFRIFRPWRLLVVCGCGHVREWRIVRQQFQYELGHIQFLEGIFGVFEILR